jgi:REP element-mobilizing transposase RayT
MAKHLFTMDAFVLLPDHLHCLWTLPDGDGETQIGNWLRRRIGNIRVFTVMCVTACMIWSGEQEEILH